MAISSFTLWQAGSLLQVRVSKHPMHIVRGNIDLYKWIWIVYWLWHTYKAYSLMKASIKIM
jgi:hypothetical protein